MPPKKRKQTSDHDAVATGRTKIRKKHGAATVDNWSHQNVLLYLRDLPPGASDAYGQGAFQNAVDGAVAGAVDKGLGPSAVISLERYTGGCDNMVFGNQAAGDLIGGLLGVLDDGGAQMMAEVRTSADEAVTKARQAKGALAYLQGIIPLDARNTLAHSLGGLVDPLQDAGWVYGILWGAALLWMDTRLRSMKNYLRHVGAAPQEPVSLQGRLRMVNTRVHGGNLRVDALVCQISFGLDRHGDGNYDVYIAESFKKTYEMSVDDGFWLAKHGDMIDRNIDWGFTVGLIDKYVGCRDMVAEAKQKPLNYAAAHAAFQRFTAHVTTLIASAKNDPKWSATADDIATFDQNKTMLWDFARNGGRGLPRSGLCTARSSLTGLKPLICETYRPREKGP